MLYNIILVLHVLVAISLVALVLLQQGKGADAGAAFGSGASGTVFGARGAANFLTRATAILATLFFILSLVLFRLAGDITRTESLVDQAAQQQEQQQEQQPAGEGTVPVAPQETTTPDGAPVDVPKSD
jgi:preprotein translocase subunit SecG